MNLLPLSPRGVVEREEGTACAIDQHGLWCRGRALSFGFASEDPPSRSRREVSPAHPAIIPVARRAAKSVCGDDALPGDHGQRARSRGSTCSE